MSEKEESEKSEHHEEQKKHDEKEESKKPEHREHEEHRKEENHHQSDEKEKDKHKEHKEEKHSEKRKKNNSSDENAKLWLTISIILAVALLISVLSKGFTQWSPNTLTGKINANSNQTQNTNGNNNVQTTTNSGSGTLIVYIVDNPKCTYCDNDNTISSVKKVFQGYKVQVIDYNSKEGQNLISKLGLNSVPAMVFDKNELEASQIWQKLRHSAFTLKGSYYYLPGNYFTRYPYYLDKQKREEFEAKIAPQLKMEQEFVKNATSGKPRIDFFVMAYCPYGNQAEEAIAPVYEALKNDATFAPHYIIYNHYNGGSPSYCIANGTLCSMHGVQEVHEDEREICVYKSYGIKGWFEFALAMNKNSTPDDSDSKWKGVAEPLNMDTAKIQQCVDSEGVKDLQYEQNLDNAVGASGSPTLFFNGIMVDRTGHISINGKVFSVDRNPNGIRNILCKFFEGTKPEGCSTQLNATATAPTGSCS